MDQVIPHINKKNQISSNSNIVNIYLKNVIYYFPELIFLSFYIFENKISCQKLN